MIPRYLCSKPPNHARKSGFSLVEVMVTLLVLSVGLLGIAALQVVTLQSSSTSLHRSMAVIQANDLVERLWANICDVSDEGRREAIEDAWDDVHHDSIPGRTVPSLAKLTRFDDGLYEIEIEWDESRVGGGLQSFVFFTRFPALPECDPS